MGYTHHFERKELKDHDKETWNTFVQDCKTLSKNLKKAGKVQYQKYNPKTNTYEEVEGFILLNGCYAYKHAVFNNRHIVFNGTSIPSKDRVKQKDEKSGKEYWSADPSDLGHETFSLTRKYISRDFNFCKTARKPYDLMVTACLVLYKYYFKEEVSINSNGDLEDWDAAFKFIGTVLPHGKQIALELLIDDGAELFKDLE